MPTSRQLRRWTRSGIPNYWQWRNLRHIHARKKARARRRQRFWERITQWFGQASIFCPCGECKAIRDAGLKALEIRGKK